MMDLIIFLTQLFTVAFILVCLGTLCTFAYVTFISFWDEHVRPK